MSDEITPAPKMADLLGEEPAQETQPEQTPETTEPAVPDVPQTLKDMPEETRQQQLMQIVSMVAQGYQTQDYVREIRVHPEDVETVARFMSQVDMPDIVRQLLNIVPNQGQTWQPGFIKQSQVETEWLGRNFADLGLIEYIKAKGAPLLLTHQDMKMLFLLSAVDELKARRNKIIVPG